jgi:uncharacterized small protein (DUF1192 family)
MVICPGDGAVLKRDLISQPARRLQPAAQLNRREDLAMSMDDDDRPRKTVSHQIGQDLSLLSVEELNERVALLTAEIERLKQAAAKKRASKDAADGFFKR